MATTIHHKLTRVGAAGKDVLRAAVSGDGPATAERQASACVIEVVPEGGFLTAAVGVPLRRMRGPAARARVPMGQEASRR